MSASLPEAFAAAVEHHRAGRYHEAEKLYRQILHTDPQHADAWHLLGMLAHEAQRNDLALDHIGRAIALNPSVAAYHSNRGLVQATLGALEQAAGCFEEALRLRPDYAEAHNNLGSVLRAQGRHGEALAHFRQAVQHRPDFAEAHHNLAVALADRGSMEEALQHLKTCLSLKPNYTPARDLLRRLGQSAPGAASSPPAANAADCFQQATLQTQQGRLDEAVQLYRQGLQIDPRAVAAWNNLGNALQELGRLDEAVAAYRQALTLQPGYADAHNNLGNTLQRGNRLDEAVAEYRRALGLEPTNFAAHANLGVLFKDQGKLAEASRHLQAALAVRNVPALHVLLATLLPPVYQSLDELEEYRRRLRANLRRLRDQDLRFDVTAEAVPNLFYLAYQGGNDRDFQRDLAEVYLAGGVPTAPLSRNKREGKIRLGILSKYLKDHTIGQLMRGLFPHLDRAAFTVTALVFDPVRDPVTEFVRVHADQYVILPDHVAGARRVLADLGLDVLFYADLGMDPTTYTLAFSRLAPVQCVTWGHPVTTGIPTVDYFLSSELTEPAAADHHYTEALVRLKTLPFCYERPAAPAALKDRDHFGLAAGDHVYACLQTLFKFHPEFDELLAGILRRDPQGRLVLLKGKHAHWDELLRERWRRTMPDVLERVHWLPPQPRPDFLSLMAMSDVLLDTLHFSGGNTSYEALALGVPLITLPSAYLRGRLTYGLYEKMGVRDCVAATPAEYVERAVALGTDAAYRETVRARIRAASGVLFDDLSAVRELETFFQQALAVAGRNPGASA